MKVKDINKLMEQLHKDKREAFSKHQVWLMLSEHNAEVPTFNVVPSEDRPTGEWTDNHNGTFTCDQCGCKHSKSNYCPNCGAKMVREDGEE